MFELRDYQQRAVDETRRAIAEGYRSIMIQSPTGSGKGVILSYIINSANMKGKTVLFLVHRSEILYQVSDYMDKYEITHGIIKAGEEPNYTHPVQLASFQTIHRRMKFYSDTFDLIVIDESHHSTAKTYLEVITAFKKNIILGFSATPTRKNGMGLGNLFDKLIQVASIQELTDKGFLAPVRYFAPVQIDLSGVKLQAGDYNEKQLEPVMLKEGLIAGIVEYWQKYGEGRKTVVFATGVAHSVAIKEKFLAAGIVAEHLDGTTPKEVRAEIIRYFKKGDIQILVNCQILTEGVDVPDIACVILARPTKSLPMYMQMLGRGMRVFDGKKDMILLDHAGCVYEHGFVHEITEWELDETKQTENKKEKKRKEKNSKPINCPECCHVYTGQLKCPQCGNIPEKKQFGQDVDYIDGQLGEVCYKTKKAAPEKFSKEMKQEWFCQLTYYAKQKGYKEGWVAQQYRSRFSVWPKGLDYHVPPGQNSDVLNWIKSKQIAYAKAKEKAANGQARNREISLPL